MASPLDSSSVEGNSHHMPGKKSAQMHISPINGSSGPSAMKTNATYKTDSFAQMARELNLTTSHRAESDQTATPEVVDSSDTAFRPPTILSAKNYSGVPKRLFDEAKELKISLYSKRTMPRTVPRSNAVPCLPPRMTIEEFGTAMADLYDRIGGHLKLNEDPLVDGWYMEHPNTHDAFHIAGQEDLVCSAVIYPYTTEEVQKIVKWANEYLIPICPISMGRSLGYGGAAPRVPGSVVIDLGRRMNKVLSLDGENASCMVEPGVSFFSLYEEIQKKGLPLWIDTPDLGGGSVMGSALERGFGNTPHSDQFTNHCGMEIVLPTGDLIRTGMGALPGTDGQDNPAWNSFQPAYGPYSDGIFSQSNFGIVTKMGFWLMPAITNQSYMITFSREEDLEAIVDTIRSLAVKRILNNVPQLRHVTHELAFTGKPKSHWYNGEGPIPSDTIRDQASSLPCGNVSWIFFGTQYGNQDTIGEQIMFIEQEFAKIKDSKIFTLDDLSGDHQLYYRDQVCSGVPVLKDLEWLNWVPNAAQVIFTPIIPTSGHDARVIHDIVSRAHKKYGFDLFPTLCISSREIRYTASIIYNRADADEKKSARAMMREMIDLAAKEGYGQSRTHLLFADQVARTYSWNDQALMKFNETLKDALDPNGILAPGRNGIWPKRFRGKGWDILSEERMEQPITPSM